MVQLESIRAMKTPLRIELRGKMHFETLSGPFARAIASQRRLLNAGPGASDESVDVPQDGVIVVIGKESPVKEQFCKDLTTWIGGTLLNTRELVRAECTSGTEEGTKLMELLTTGKLIPQELLAELVRGSMTSGRAPFVLSDFPTTVSQLQLLEGAVGTVRLALLLQLEGESIEQAQAHAARVGLESKAHVIQIGTKAVSAAASLFGVAAPTAAAAAAAGVATVARVVLVMGRDSEQKEEFCDALASRLGSTLLRTRELVKAACVSDTDEGMRLMEILSSGKILPPEMMVELIRREVEAAEAPVLLTGFPSTARQLQLLEEALEPVACALQLRPDGETEEAVLQQLQRVGGGRLAAIASVVPVGAGAVAMA